MQGCWLDTLVNGPLGPENMSCFKWRDSDQTVYLLAWLSINQSINKSINQSINLSIYLINPSINQSINLSKYIIYSTIIHFEQSIHISLKWICSFSHSNPTLHSDMSYVSSMVRKHAESIISSLQWIQFRIENNPHLTYGMFNLHYTPNSTNLEPQKVSLAIFSGVEGESSTVW